MQPTDFGIKNLPDFLGLVDERLKELASENIGGVKRLLNARGKRWRPSLVIAVAFYSDTEINEKVIDAAAAVELVHLASLVHDDIIDNGTLRHGIATINSKEGVDLAILAGDYLFAKGCALASSISAEAGRQMAETIAYLSDGQAAELMDDFNLERTEESLIAAIKGKTSSMFSVSCVLGGLAAGLKPGQIKALSDFGENLGIAYQYTDDIRDFTESPESSGKSVGNDIREGKYTLPVIYSLQGPNKSGLTKLLKKDNVPTRQVLEILEKDGSMNRVKKEAEAYKQKAVSKLQILDNPKLTKALQKLVNSF